MDGVSHHVFANAAFTLQKDGAAAPGNDTSKAMDVREAITLADHAGKWFKVARLGSGYDFQFAGFVQDKFLLREIKIRFCFLKRSEYFCCMPAGNLVWANELSGGRIHKDIGDVGVLLAEKTGYIVRIQVG